MISSFRALIRDAWKILGLRLPVLVAATLVGAVLEGVTVAALLPLFSGLGGATGSGSSDRVTKLVQTVIGIFGLSTTPLSVAGLVTALIVLSALVSLAQAHMSARLLAIYVSSWQRRLFSGLLAADYSFFRARRSGDLIAATINEPTRVGLAFSQAIVMLSAALFILAQIVIALFVSSTVVAFLLVFAGMLFLATRGLARRAFSFGQGMTDVNADLTADASEIISGSKFIKATATERRALVRLFRAVDRMELLTFGNAFEGQIVRAVFEYASGLIVIALLVVGPLLLAVDVGVVLIVVAMFVRIFPKITGLRQSAHIVAFHLPGFNTAVKLLNEAEAVRESSDIETPMGWPHLGPALVNLQHVSVSIDSQAILDDVSLEIPTGAFVTVIGATGAGKTTLLDCILGLRRPTSGKVLIDGYPLELLPNSLWREGIGYLGQEPVLLNASIGDNLRWIRPETTTAELLGVLKAASAEFVERMPDGLNTPVGDRGGRLSGGERQRIALARALLGSPRLLVLDEATSALDSSTEELVADAIAGLRGQMTIVAITHRPALSKRADIVVQMEGGRVVKIDRQRSV